MMNEQPEETSEAIISAVIEPRFRRFPFGYRILVTAWRSDAFDPLSILSTKCWRKKTAFRHADNHALLMDLIHNPANFTTK